MDTYLGIAGCILFLLLTGAGYGRGETQETSPAAAVEQVGEIQARLLDLAQEACFISVLLEGVDELRALEDPEQRWMLFQWLVERAREEGNAETAVTFVYALAKGDAQWAAAAVQFLDATMMERDPARWIAGLQAGILPPMFRVHGYSLWFRAYAAEAAVPELARRLLALDAPDLVALSQELFRDVLDMLFRQEDRERLRSLLEHLRPALPAASPLYPYVLHVEGRALARDGKTSEALVHYQAHAEVLGDARIAGEITGLLEAAAATRQPDLVEAIKAWGYSQAAFRATRNRVARWELGQLKGTTDAGALVAGVEAVLAQGIPVQMVASYFIANLLYPALPQASQDGLEALRDLVREMDAAARAEGTPGNARASFGAALLDMDFYLGDYRGALERVKQGIPGFDAEWHAELHDKIQAHLAQAEGRIADAVGFYAAHIERVRGWERAQISPEDGRRILPEEVIALNERRIGDLWAAAGEQAKAAAAYARARAAYASALEKYGDDAESAGLMQAALHELAAQEAAPEGS